MDKRERVPPTPALDQPPDSDGLLHRPTFVAKRPSALSWMPVWFARQEAAEARAEREHASANRRWLATLALIGLTTLAVLV